MPRRSEQAVVESRSRTIDAAVDLASVEGLEGLTIGRLADQLAMSKSGLIGRFGDKEAMQRAVLAAAVQRFTDAVWAPAQAASPGLERVGEVIDRWVEHLRGEDFPGGCFVTTASVEYDARPGALHDDVARMVARWLRVLEHELTVAREQGHVAGLDPADAAFALHGLASGGGVAARLTGDPEGLARLRRAMRHAVGLPVGDGDG
jgi:AcrR family transcriptional regulator